MKEIAYQKSIPAASDNAAYSRLASRLVKDFRRAYGTNPPPEINAICAQIRAGKEVEPYDDEYKNTILPTHSRAGARMYNTCDIINETHITAYWEQDEYGDDVYSVSWYFFDNCVYAKKVGGKTITAGSLHELYIKEVKAKGKYRYFATHRPPYHDCIPAGYISYETYIPGSEQIGEVTYDEPPPQEELTRWGLRLDKDWATIRQAVLEEAGA